MKEEVPAPPTPDDVVFVAVGVGVGDEDDVGACEGISPRIMVG